MICIIKVNKEEAAAIREKFPDVQIVRTCIHKSNQHTYYAVESRGVMQLVRNMRGGRYAK